MSFHDRETKSSTGMSANFARSTVQDIAWSSDDTNSSTLVIRLGTSSSIYVLIERRCYADTACVGLEDEWVPRARAV